MSLPGPWLEKPAQAGVMVDFDGTLSPIVDSYDLARPLVGADELLARLAGRLALVAVVSGRPASWLQEQLPAAGATLLVGLYGLERAKTAGDVERMAGSERWAAVMETAYRAAVAGAPVGVRVEDKGLAVTIHYREAPAASEWAGTRAQEVSRSSGLEVHPGKMSVELRPPLLRDKGSVVEELASGLREVCFVGDDVGDLPAFAALERLRSRGANTLAVAVASPEAPQELVQAADLVLEGPEEVLSFLASLEGQLGAD